MSSYDTWPRQSEEQHQHVQQEQSSYPVQNDNTPRYSTAELWNSIGEGWQAVEEHEQRRVAIETRINTQQLNVAENLLTGFSFGGETTGRTNSNNLTNYNNFNQQQQYNNVPLIQQQQQQIYQQATYLTPLIPSQQMNLTSNLAYQNPQIQSSLDLQQPLMSNQHQVPKPLAQSHLNHYPVPLRAAPLSNAPRRFQPSYDSFPQNQQISTLPPQQQLHYPTDQPPLISRDSGFLDVTGTSRHRSISSYGHYHNLGALAGYPEGGVSIVNNSTSWSGVEQGPSEASSRRGSLLYSDTNGQLYDIAQSYIPSPPETLLGPPHLEPQNFTPRISTSFSNNLPPSIYEQQHIPMYTSQPVLPLPSQLPTRSPTQILDTPPSAIYRPLHPYNDDVVSPPDSGKTVSPQLSQYSDSTLEQQQQQINYPSSPNLVPTNISVSTKVIIDFDSNPQSKRSRVVMPKVPLVTPSTSKISPSSSNQMKEDTSPEEEHDDGEEGGGSNTFAVLGPASKQHKKVIVEVDCICTGCGIAIAKLILRARPTELAVPYTPVFTCMNCSPQVNSSNNNESSHSPDSATTSNRHSNSPPGISISASTLNTNTAIPQLSAVPIPNPTFRKKFKRSNDSLTACDVCLREISYGSVITNSTSIPVSYAVEVICTSCSSKYRRCTDCGGGGGVRLGVGKWRCKEMFAEGRRTCKLSHLRLGKFEEMTYEIWKIVDVPDEEMGELEEKVKDLFVSTLLSAMAIPEILERASVQVGIASLTDYASVEQFALGGFDKLSDMLKVDIEPTRSIRRYISLRFCTPNPRKGLKKIETPASADKNYVVLRPSQELVGFVLAEYDYVYGTLFTSVVVPWATGDVLDATTSLLQKLLARVDSDRTALNIQRASYGHPEEFPMLLHVWTMMFFAKDSRMRVHLEKKRGFILFDEYLRKYPDTDLRAFPPLRPTYVPAVALPYWDLLIKRGGPNVFVSRRTAEDLKGKKRAAKAEQVRLLESKGIIL